jgi:homoserine O-acetyltransferase
MHSRKLYSGTLLAWLCLGAVAAGNAADLDSRPLDGDYIIHDFHFASGETLPELRMHYTYLGKPKKDALGHVTNAVLIMHGTGGSGRSLINERFSGVLFQKGQLLDAAKYYIILPDNTSC